TAREALPATCPATGGPAMPPRPWPLDVDVDVVGQTIKARFPAQTRLDTASLPVLREHLARLLEGLGPCRVVLDLANVSFLFSDVRGALVSFHKKVRAAGGRLVLCNPRPEVAEVLAVTGLDRVLDVRPGDLLGAAKPAPQA